MPSSFTQAPGAAEFILTEAENQRSRATAVVASGSNLEAGTVLKRSAGKLVAYDGSGTVVGVLIGAVDATDGDCAGSFLAREAEVNRNLLTMPDGFEDAAIAGLELLGIEVRGESDATINLLTLGGVPLQLDGQDLILGE